MKTNRQISIKRSFSIIQGVVGLLLVFLIIEGCILWRVCDSGASATTGLANEGLPSLRLLASLQEGLAIYRLHSYELMFVQDKDRAAKIAETDDILQKNTQTLQDLAKLYPAGEGHQYVANVQASFDDYVKTMSQIRIQLDKDFGTAMKMMDEDVPAKVKQLADDTQALTTYCNQVADERTGLTVTGFTDIRKWVIRLGSLSIGFALLACVLVTVNSSAVRRALNLLADTLGQVSQSLIGSGRIVSTSSQSLAEGSSSQAASIEETSASLEEMSSMTRRNSDNAQKANEIAKEARSAAEKGAVDMQAMNTAMAAIKASSDDIAKIIKTIDEIAFQTNILALNAAVEAARAGEAGMGFSVVADEVRNLAQRSAQAARETAAKIEGAITNADRGVELNRKVSSALNEIVEKARHVDELVAQVAGASREQTQGIAQINLAVNQMDKVTQGNAASAEECAAAGGELKSQARAMNDAVCALLQLLGGQSAGDSTGATGLDQRNGSVPVHVDVAPISVRRNAPGVNGHHRPVTPPAGTRTGRIIVWDAATMSTGVESVDAQHRTLIDRINELHSACEAGTAREKLLEMLSFLGEYAQNHFKEEEGIMQQHRCPVRGQNKAAHIQFLADYEHLVEIVKRDGPTTSTVIQIKKMLANWLTNHICRVDANLRNCAKNTGR